MYVKQNTLKGFTVLLIFILLVQSCTQHQANRNATVTGSSMQKKTLPPELPKSATVDSSTAVPPEFITLKGQYPVFLDRMGLAGFAKLVFVPYQRDKHDDVRMFCYASKIDEYRENDKPYRIGQPFILSKDGTGEDPATLNGALIKHRLSLGKVTMEKIVAMAPEKPTYLIFTPVSMTHDTEGKYTAYKVFKDEKNTSIILNPSPPGFTGDK